MLTSGCAPNGPATSFPSEILRKLRGPRGQSRGCCGGEVFPCPEQRLGFQWLLGPKERRFRPNELQRGLTTLMSSDHDNSTPASLLERIRRQPDKKDWD